VKLGISLTVFVACGLVVAGCSLEQPVSRITPDFVTGIPSTDGLKAPDGTPAMTGSYRASVPGGWFDERGTVAVWVRPDRTLLEEPDLKMPILSGPPLRTRIYSRGNATCILTDAGPAMTGANPEGEAAPYRYQSLLTRVDGQQWYLMAWTWDTTDAQGNDFLLDGISQGGTARYKYPGQLTPAEGSHTLEVGCPGLTVSAVQLFAERLSPRQLQSLCRAVGHEGYTTEGVRFSGETFVPQDVDWDHPVYQTSFDDEVVLDDWTLEGGWRKRIEEGCLILENGPDPADPDHKAQHLVCWLKPEIPADFLLEFTVRPAHRDQGLNIVFFNARGVGGESIFDASLAPRDGTFRQYTEGDINCYHASYWAAGRETTNMRKNKGFHLVAIGRDLVMPGPADGFQTIRLYKRGGTIRLTVDDVLAVGWDDDGRTYGPVHDHSGWIGLRQMLHTESCAYGRLAVWPLKP
jgi:hypothetical protein